MPSRHRVFLPLPPLVVLVLAVSCAPQPSPNPSEQLDALLMEPGAYPTGFTVETIDVGHLDDGPAPEATPEGVEPAECVRLFDVGTAALPARAAEGAGQIATSATPPVLYSFLVVSGDLPEESTTPRWAGLMDRCTQMTVMMDGMELHGGLSAEDSPALPEDGGMVSMRLSADEMELSARVAWGRVRDVQFVLTALDLIAAPAVSTPELVDVCIEDPTDFDCVEEQREVLAEQSRQESAEEFEGVLSRAVERLARG